MTEKSKTVLTISRHWNNPMITCVINGEGIAISIHLSDFKEAVKAELMEEFKLYLSKSEMPAAIDKAFNDAVEGVKEESAKVIL